MKKRRRAAGFLLVYLYKTLYNKLVKNLFDLFTSRARVMVLRTLSCQERPIPLRHVSRISGLPVLSVQHAVASLADEKIITRTEEDNNVLFELNREHPFSGVLEQIFTLETNARIRSGARGFHQKAKRALEFASAANAMFKGAKQVGH